MAFLTSSSNGGNLCPREQSWRSQPPRWRSWRTAQHRQALLSARPVVLGTTARFPAALFGGTLVIHTSIQCPSPATAQEHSELAERNRKWIARCRPLIKHVTESPVIT